MLRASLRDTALLLGEFRTALIVFLVAIFGSALLYFSIARQVGEPLRNFTEAIYIVLSLAFFQPPGDFPENPFLEAFFRSTRIQSAPTTSLPYWDARIFCIN